MQLRKRVRRKLKRKESILDVFVKISYCIASIDFRNVEIGSNADLDRVIAYVTYVLHVFTQERRWRKRKKQLRRKARVRSHKESVGSKSEDVIVHAQAELRHKTLRHRKRISNRPDESANITEKEDDEVTSPPPPSLQPLQQDEPPREVLKREAREREALLRRREERNRQQAERERHEAERIQKEEIDTCMSFIVAVIVLTFILLCNIT